jgi:hypothetical protein
MKLAELESARPGTNVDVLCVVLGVEGPRAYNTSDGCSSFYARVQIADATAPSGVPLLFFGPSAHRVLSFRPYLPICFSQVAVKQRDRFGVISLVWCASRSSVDRNPGHSTALCALEIWSIAEFGPLVGAAREGFVKTLCNPDADFHVTSRNFRKPGLRSKELSVNQDLRFDPLIESRRELHKPDASALRARARGAVCQQCRKLECVHIHDSGDLTVTKFLSDVSQVASHYLVRIRVLAAKFPVRSRKRTHSAQTLTPLLIRSLALGGCQEGCKAGATWRFPGLHLEGCRPETYDTFWLRVRDEATKCAVVAVTGIAAERIMLGVRAHDARKYDDSAEKAVSAIRALLTEQGPFDAIVSTSYGNSSDASSGDSVGSGSPSRALQLLQLFV